jgi:hypothetical protein
MALLLGSRVFCLSLVQSLSQRASEMNQQDVLRPNSRRAMIATKKPQIPGIFIGVGGMSERSFGPGTDV